MSILKRLQHISAYERWMLVVVAVATLLRLVLIYFHWPVTNSDEGNMGLVALHVAFQGDHPVFFYGANYLGPFEGYAAAPLFRLFGASLFALRLPLVLCFTGFLLSVYYLVRLLYQSEKFALASVILLGLGSQDVLFLQLRASGEYPETELFAALMCLLAVWLALTTYSARQPVGRQELWKRVAIYCLLGLVIGIALWVDLLILPFVAAVFLLLALFCHRELLRWPGLGFLAGLIAGAFPLIYYNLTAPWAQNSWYVLQGLHASNAGEMLALHMTWVNQFMGTMFVALPIATGGSLHCPLSAIPPTGAPAPATLTCVLFQGIWGFGYLLLWFVAAALAIYTLWGYRFRLITARSQGPTLEERQVLIRQCGRLMILASVGLTLLLYALSPASALFSDTTFRYLTCLLLAVPVLLWPLWHSLSERIAAKRGIWPRAGLLLRGSLLLLVAAPFLGGTVRTFVEIPSAQQTYQTQQAVIQDLLHIGATRVYSDYWTCNNLTFLSHEKIICSAVDAQLNPGYDRYLPYHFIVRAAPHPAYIFPAGLPQVEAIQQRVRASSQHYRYFTFEGYIVYQMT